MRRLAGLALAALAAAGCSLLAPPAAPDAAPAPSIAARLFSRSSADELVAYLDRLRGMNESALEAEVTRQRQAMVRSADDLTRVKTALALTLARPAEEGDILTLVEPVTRKASGDADVKAVASFLQVLANERRRLRESATAAGNKLREERRATEAQKQRADALQERATQLQQKLDALTEIEKSLSDRQPPSR